MLSTKSADGRMMVPGAVRKQDKTNDNQMIRRKNGYKERKQTTRNIKNPGLHPEDVPG